MPQLPTTATSLLRVCARKQLPTLQATSIAAQRRGKADARASYASPFSSIDESRTTKIPDFSKYMSKKPETSNRVFQYFMVGSMGALAAMGAKAAVQGMYMKM